MDVILLLLGLAVPFGWEAVKEVGWRRYGAGAIAASCVLLALLWFPLSRAFPSAALVVSSVAGNPQTWFALFLLGAAIVIFTGPQFRKPPAEMPRHEPVGAALVAELPARFEALGTDLQQVRRIVEKGHHTDILHLLDWTVHHARIGVMERLAAEAPKIEETQPDQDPKTRADALDDARAYIRKVTSDTRSTIDGHALFGFLSDVGVQGDRLVKAIPDTDRPSFIGPYDFRDYYITAYQCNRLAEWLRFQAREIHKELEPYQLDRLSERLKAHQPKP